MRRGTSILLLVAVIICMVSAYPLWRIFKIRYTAYSFRVKQDYVYDFSRTDAVRIPCRLTQGILTLPESARGYDTAFLRVRVATTWLGMALQPRIHTVSGDIAASESVEYGARGVRYLNVSRFTSAGSREIRLAGDHVVIDESPAELILFRNPDVRKARVLVIAPHPDDAEIAAYGLYSAAAESFIVTLTAGEANDLPGEIPLAERMGYQRKGRVRVWDSLVIPYLGGVPPGNVVNLGYFDNTLQSMYRDKNRRIASRSTGYTELTEFRGKNVSRLLADVPAIPTWSSLVNDLRTLLTRIKPEIIVALYPALDYNTDHKYSTVALFEALRLAGASKGLLYLYTNHYTLTDYYPFGVEGDPITLPPHFGPPLYFRQICSHPLDEAKIRDKLDALDAMHDLRPEPKWRTVAGTFETFTFLLESQIYGRDYSYYRRALRSNELFFVVPLSAVLDGEATGKILGDI